jgi:hypothetical protein
MPSLSRLANFLTALLASLVLFAAGCRKEELCIDCIRLQYNQTQCADPWGYGTDGSDAQVQLAVRDFFTSNGVRVYEVGIGGEEALVTCAACTCGTGKVIYVVTDAGNRSAFEAHGFY